MNKKSLYDEFLINQNLVELERGKKLEENFIKDGRFVYSINPDILDSIIDVLAFNGSIKNDEVTKNIYKNSYLFARKVAYHDYFKGSRGLLHDQIMEEIFENAVDVINNLQSSSKNLTDAIRYEYSGCFNLKLYQNELIDNFGLKDGKIKRVSVGSKKHNSIDASNAFMWFCNLFIDSTYKKTLKRASK